MATRLTAEQFQQRYGSTNTFNQPQEPSFLNRVGQDISGVKQEIKSASEQAIEGKIGIGRQVLRTGGAVAGGVFDVLGEGIKSVLGKQGTQAVKEVVNKATGQIMKIDPVEDAVIKMTNWARQNPQAAKDLENIIDIAGVVPIGKGIQVGTKGIARGIKATKTLAQEGTEVLGKGLALTGAAGEKTGKKIISTLYTPTAQQAQQVINYQSRNTMLERLGWAAKDLEKAPKTLADAIIKYNLSGVARGNIGARAKGIARDLFENQVNPVLSGIKEKVTKKELFSAIEKDILKVEDISRRKGLLNAFEALSDDYKNVSAWNYKTLDKIKSSMSKRLPSKVWRGQEVAGDLNNVRVLFAAKAREMIRKKLPQNIVDIYDDYGSLVEIAARGAKALQRGFDAGILGITSEAIRILATPITTIGGRGVVEAGKAIKKAGQFLQK